MDTERRAQVLQAIREAQDLDHVFEILDVSPTSPEATLVEIMWEALKQ